MRVTKGLIIADPWIRYILDRSKKWEMRSTSFRGPFALIRKGTGAISGIATLVDTGRALNRVEMIESVEKHLIPAELILSGEVSKWNIPWIIADVRQLANPVPYAHPNGAVTWVNLAEAVSGSVSEQLDGSTKLSA